MALTSSLQEVVTREKAGRREGHQEGVQGSSSKGPEFQTCDPGPRGRRAGLRAGPRCVDCVVRHAEPTCSHSPDAETEAQDGDDPAHSACAPKPGLDPQPRPPRAPLSSPGKEGGEALGGHHASGTHCMPALRPLRPSCTVFTHCRAGIISILF